MDGQDFRSQTSEISALVSVDDLCGNPSLLFLSVGLPGCFPASLLAAVRTEMKLCFRLVPNTFFLICALSVRSAKVLH